MVIVLGSIICVLGGVGIGSFLLPLKYSRSWTWENSWVVAAFFMYVLFPPIALFWLVPDFREIYALTPGKDLDDLFLRPHPRNRFAYFHLWDPSDGLSLGYALMIGCIALVSLLVPLSWHMPTG
jgi:hypothetical protein